MGRVVEYGFIQFRAKSRWLGFISHWKPYFWRHFLFQRYHVTPVLRSQSCQNNTYAKFGIRYVLYMFVSSYFYEKWLKTNHIPIGILLDQRYWIFQREIKYCEILTHLCQNYISMYHAGSAKSIKNTSDAGHKRLISLKL